MPNLIETEIENGIAIVWAGNPPVNAISHAVREGLVTAFRDLRETPKIKAIILACRGRTFFAGADISEFDGPAKDPHLQEVFNAIEDMPVPVVAAMFGTALGGGMEAALACHYRIAERSAKMGLPEIHLGIFPGAGGTQRLPRLISMADALDIIIKGKPLGADKALALGLVDKIVDGDVVEAARAFTMELLNEGKGPRKTSRQPVRKEGAGEAFKTFEGYISTRLKGRKNPSLAIKALRMALEGTFEEGLALERKLNLAAKKTLESKALRHLFFAERQTGKIPGLDKNVGALEIKTIGVLGAGTMGTGIAMAFANVGFPVTLVENNDEALKRGLGVIEKTLQAAVQKGRVSEKRALQTRALVEGTTVFKALQDQDLVIEAVFEDMALKKEIFRKLDQTCKPGAILATNTSTLDVDEIAAVTGRPEKVLGLHFFSPANIMPLLEVVRGAKTSGEILATGLSIGKKIGKKPVVSGVCFGFIGNRMLSPYGREGQRMLLEGPTPRVVDSALEEFGMAMGILAVYDLAGIDVGYKVREAMGKMKPGDPTFFKASEVMYNAGRYGQKTGAGFYKYEKASRQRLEDPLVMNLISAAARKLGIGQKTIGREEIIERCFYPLVNEAANILAEGIALRSSDIDVVWTSGYGFPRHLGGPMFWADHHGLDKILAGIKKFRKIFGDEFWTPAPLLERLVEEGKTFNDWDKKKL